MAALRVGNLDPADTLALRREKMRGEMNREELPIALVAHEGSELMGSASLRASDLETRPELSPWLGGVFVAPEHRGRGVGSRLVESVEELALRLGHSRLYLFTTDRAAFYSRRGWRRLEEDVYRGEEILIMEKDLE